MNVPMSSMGRMFLNEVNSSENRKWLAERVYDPHEPFFWYKKSERECQPIIDFIDEAIFIEQDDKRFDELVEFRDKCIEAYQTAIKKKREGWMYHMDLGKSRNAKLDGYTLKQL